MCRFGVGVAVTVGNCAGASVGDVVGVRFGIGIDVFVCLCVLVCGACQGHVWRTRIATTRICGQVRSRHAHARVAHFATNTAGRSVWP